jgi:hypothetical protein
MKIRSLLSLFLVLTFAVAAFSQTVKITPRKVVYRRPKPMSAYKRSFTITYPRVTGLSPALNKKVEASLSFRKHLDLDLKEELRDMEWLEEAGYEVNYNKKGVLVVTLSMEGSGAYPSSSSRTVVVDLKTGDQVRTTELFSNLAGLAALCRKAQKAEIAQAIVDIKKDYPEEEDLTSLFADAKFTIKDLEEFSIDDNGVTFLYDYGFPHVALALQPDGRYFFDWKQLKPFLKPGSLLQRLVR